MELNNKIKPKLWRPYTQEGLNPPALKAVKAKGSKIYLEDGRILLDCISSWWLNLHGHCCDEISEALNKQTKIVEQVVFADFTHDAAEELVTELSQILPPSLDSYFLSDNGSTAVEVALKMILGFWFNKGFEEKNTFIAFNGSYHGDTFGAMSVSQKSIFTKQFSKLLFEIETVDYPWISECELSENLEAENRELSVLNEIENILESKSQKIAGIIIEPLVQGTSGMTMCSSSFLQKLSQLATSKNCPLIFDEVMTGFGRTGDWFSCIKSGVTPDIICLSKGLSGGVLPLGLTVSTDEIFRSFNDGKFENTLFHGHSYTGNALSCSTAVASIKHLKNSGEKFRDFEKYYRELYGLYLKDLEVIETPRFCGTIFAFEVKTNDKNYGSQFGKKLKARLIEEGVYLRPLGNTLYLMPPYCFSKQELEVVFCALRKVILSTL